jgi:hypothetical protein
VSHAEWQVAGQGVPAQWVMPSWAGTAPATRTVFRYVLYAGCCLKCQCLQQRATYQGRSHKQLNLLGMALLPLQEERSCSSAHRLAHRTTAEHAAKWPQAASAVSRQVRMRCLPATGVKAATAAKVASAGAAGAKFVASTVAGSAIGVGIDRAINSGPSTTVVCQGACTVTSSLSVSGCNNEGCLCEAMGPGVHPNVFDNTCSTFFHCPGPKRPCGPGTLFNPEFNVCDWPHNVKCVAVRVA